MEKLHWTWKKIVSLILGFLGIGTLTSCYGMPFISEPEEMYGMPRNKYSVSGTVTDDTNIPLEKIKISVREAAFPEENEYKSFVSYSDNNGEFVVTVYTSMDYNDPENTSRANEFTATFTDSDTDAEKLFIKKEITITYDDEDIIKNDEQWLHKNYSKDIGQIKLEKQNPGSEE